MCGRARCSLRAADVPRAAHIPDGSFRSVHMDRYRPSYNVSPGYYMPVVRREDMSDGHGAVLHCMKWGLIPSFTKKNEKPDHYKMFNARSESINEKASFRRLVPNNRCIVAVEGFYEWKKDGSKKQPYYIHLKDGRPLVFAALYDSWRDSEGETLYTFTILTTSSASTLQWLHDRMPVILGDKESTDAWLSSSSSSKHDVLLKPYENSDLVWYPVTPAMGKPSFNGPECIEEVQLKTESKSHQISKFFSKKEATNDHDSNPKHTSLSSDFMKSDMPKSVKDEIKIEGEAELSSRTYKESSDLNSNVSAISPEGAAKRQVKRDYDEFKADPDPNPNPNPTIGETDKLCSSPPKKKGGFKSADNKQPTLLSYFRKS